jgi:chromosome transmission fidelity protein 4
MLTDFDFKIPLTSPNAPDKARSADEMDTDGIAYPEESEQQRLEELYVRSSVMYSLQDDALAATRSTPSQRAILAKLENDVDKALLQLLGVECREGEERGMKCLEIVKLMRDRSGKMLDLAGKVAARFERDVLGEKIREIAERRIVGLDADNDDE